MPIKGVLNKARVPVKIWSDLATVESSALDQLTNTANLPFVFKHVAAMPDVHLGVGATVGSVIATKGAVCPAAVGVDIGCGMAAYRTNLDPKVVQDNIVRIRLSIERSVPVGHEGNRRIEKAVSSWKGWQDFTNLSVIGHTGKDGPEMWKRAQSQLGSLGGGNHFIEICLDSGSMCPCVAADGVAKPDGTLCTECYNGVRDQRVWVMLHSGSRNLGKVVAERHIDKARDFMKQMFIHLPDPDLAYFAQGTQDFQNYVADIEWCQEYAAQNRREMMTRVLKDLSYAIYNEDGRVEVDFKVNCHHNYLAKENHFGENVLVTRKGAVRARQGDLGIIPGSMGARSYIVEGLGNEESFCSCSHGAGRKMSRGAAKRAFTVKDLEVQTAGIECRKDDGVLDEIPGAYKSIDEVMANQTDLVTVLHELRQIMCIKG
jgi:tRNA-splicing ligase RtcB (3'-phosphate/5'-hydroxy nucleic acid ligase)